MLAIDVVLLVAGGVALIAIGAVLGQRLGQRGDAQRRRKLGAQNAEAIKQRLDEVCAVCGERVDPKHDVFDTGKWWHQGCYREAVR